jgi:hypothetical protein
VESGGRGLIEVLSQHLPGGIEEYHEKPSQDSRCSGRDSKRAPPKYKSKALMLYEPFRLFFLVYYCQYRSANMEVSYHYYVNELVISNTHME